jgi:Bacterial SH3 domain
MTIEFRTFGMTAMCAALVGLAGTVAQAAPGDIHRVTGAEVVNLRAGPSDESNIRGRVERGDEVIELTSDGNWRGVRVLQTGEEGWIYGGLLERESQSGLLGGDVAAAEPGGFMQLSEDFDRLIQRVNGGLGYRMVDEARVGDDGALHVVPTPAWLRAGSRDSHLMAAMAFYEMWKNHQNGRPVTMVMEDAGGTDYIRIADSEQGPELAITAP